MKCICTKTDPVCDAISDDGYPCTREAGHTGDHTACSLTRHKLREWPAYDGWPKERRDVVRKARNTLAISSDATVNAEVRRTAREDYLDVCARYRITRLHVAELVRHEGEYKVPGSGALPSSAVLDDNGEHP